MNIWIYSGNFSRFRQIVSLSFQVSQTLFKIFPRTFLTPSRGVVVDLIIMNYPIIPLLRREGYVGDDVFLFVMLTQKFREQVLPLTREGLQDEFNLFHL